MSTALSPRPCYFVFALFLCCLVPSTFIHAQSINVSACPVITKRNNGNGQASTAAGNFTGYSQNNPVASNVTGTSYQNVNYNPTAKTGDVNFKWSSSTTVTNLPVITRVWLTANGATSATLSAIVFGPPPPPSVVGQDYYVGYSFYGQNMPASGKVTLEFTDPQTSKPAFTCTYDLKTNTTATAPTIDCSPSITTQPVSQSLCGASTASFTVAGTGVSSIQWQVNNSGTWTDISNTGDYSGATTTTLTISSPNTYNGKSYRAALTGSGTCGITYSSSAILIAQPKPTAVFSTGTSLCGTGTRSLGVTLNGTAPWTLTYSSTPSGGSTTTTTVSNISSSPFYFSVNPSVNTTYAITAVSDAYCSNASPSGVVSTTVSNAPTITPSNATTCYGNNSFNLTYAATGSPDKYTLTAGVRAMPGFATVSNATLSGSPASITIPTSGVSAGVYDFNIVVTNSTTGCSSTSTAFTVTVAALPSVTATGGSGSVCTGSNITLTAAPSGLSSYSWATTTAPGTVIATGVSPSVTVNANTTYTVTGTDANGCSASSNIAVTTVAGPTLSISPSSPTICSGNATTLTASGGNTYSWSPSTGLSATTGASVVASPTTTTTYTVTSQNITGCQSSGTVTVTVNTPSIGATASATICSGSIQTLTASGGSTYVWYPSTGLYTDASATTAYTGTSAVTVYAKPTATTTYYVQGTTSQGCTGTASSTVTISQVPVNSATSVGHAYVFCSKSVSTFDLSVNLTVSADSMKWSYSTAQAGSYTNIATTGSSPSGATFTPSSSGSTNTKLTVSGYSNGGYNGPSYLRLTIYTSSCTYTYDVVLYDTKSTTLPTISVDKSTICSGETATLTIGGLDAASFGGVGGAQWTSSTSSGGTYASVVGGSGGTTGTYTTAALLATTYYKLTLTGANACGSKIIGPASVTIASPASNTIASSASCTNGSSTITITGSDVAASGVVYQWQSSSDNSTYTDILGSVSRDYSLPSTTLSATTWYRRIATVGNCSSSTSSAVAVYPAISNNQITNNTTAYCSSANITTLNGTSPAGGNGTYAYQWQQSTDGTTFSNIVGGTSQNYATAVQTQSYWYKRIATSASGACSATSGSFKITVNTPAVVSVTAGSTQCPGTPVTLTASGAVSYSWSPSTYLSATTGSSVIATVTAAGITTYTVTGTDGNGCTNTATTSITVTAAPSTPTLSSSSATICTGGSASLNSYVTSGGTYEWYTAPQVSASYLVSSPTAVSTAGTYYVFAKSAGCYSTGYATFTLNVSNVAAPSVAATSISYCSPATADLTALQPAAATSTSLEWHTVSSSPSSGNKVTSPSSVSGGTYYLYAYSSAGNCYGAASSPVTVTINAVTNASVSATSGSVCSPATIDLTSYNNTSGTNTYSWYSSNSPVAANLVAIPSQVSLSGTYYLYVTNAAGCQGNPSAGVTLTINSTPSASISSPAAVCLGTASSITATSNASSPSYVWQSSANDGASWSNIANTSVYSGAASSTLAISNTTGLGGTFYRYTVTGSNSCSATSSAAILVEDAAPSISSQPSDYTVAPGTNTSFSVVIGNSPTASYQWQVSTNGGSTFSDISDNSTYSGSTNAVLIISSPTTALNGYKYRVNVSNTCTTVTSTSALLTVSTCTPPTPSFTASPASAVCLNANVTYTTQSGASNYVWSVPGTLNTDYSISSGGTGSSSNTVTLKWLTSGSKTLTVNYTSGGCAGNTAASNTVTANVLPSVSVSPTAVAITTGAGTTLTASGADTYSWSPSTGLSATTGVSVTATPTSTTTYTVTGTNTSTSCTNTATAVVTVNPVLLAGSIGSDQTICTGSTPASLTSTTDASGGTGTISYQWQQSTDNSTFTNISSATAATYSPSSLTQTTYYKRLAQTSSDATVGSGVVTVTVQSSVGGTISGSTTVCTGTNSSTLTLNGNTGSVVKWQSSATSNFSGTVTDISNTTTSYTAANLTATTYYRAVVQNGSCTAVNSSVASVTVNALPTVSVSPTAVAITTGSSTTLTASGADTYSWSPSTGLSPTSGASVTANPTSTATYTVTGTNTTTNCVNTATVTVTVNPALSTGSIGTSQAICTGSTPSPLTSATAASGGTGTISYQWQQSTNGSSYTDISNETNATYTPGTLTRTMYYRRGASTANDAIIYTSPVTITVNAKPTISISPASATISSGSNVSLTASGADTYSWSPSTGLSATSGASVTATPSSTTTYTVTGTNTTTNCVNTATITVTVNGSLAAGSIGSDQTICSGSTPASLTSTATASGGTGTISYQWQQSTDNITFTDINTATAATYSPASLTQTMYYKRAAQTSSDAAVYTGVVTITVDALSVGGTVSGGGAVCTGTNSKTITLSGNTGSVTKWQSATTANFSGTITDITSNTSTSLTATNLTTDTYYRAVVQSGVCAATNSGNGAITVDALSVGGSISGGGAVCTGTNSKTITLNGNTGSVTKWQSATTANFSGTITDITSNTSTSLTATNLTADTYYRAVVQSGVCAATNSGNGAITVDALSVGGTVSGGGAVCTGTNSKTITLSGNTGSVTKWQSATTANFSGTVTDITSNTSTSLTATNLTADTYYRAVVQSGVCAAANSGNGAITVDALSVGGSISGGGAVCTGTNSKTITLSGNTGSVTKWQSATTANFSGTVTDITSNTSTTLTATNLTTDTYYRAVVQSGTCAAANSGNGAITVDVLSVGGSISGGGAVCTGTNSKTITLSSNTGSVTKWQSAAAADFSGTVTDITSNTSTSLTATNLTADTYYRAVVQNGTCAATNSGNGAITVDALSVGGAISGGGAVCTGTNSKTITLSGNTGSVTKWQSATAADFSGTVTDITGNTATSLTATNLTADTYYRAVVQSGVCAATNSSNGAITVDALSIGGTVNGGGAVCTGTNSKTITLNGNTGSVTKWQSATAADFSGTVTDITGNTTTSLIATNLTADTYYRAVVQNGTCAATNSGNGAVTVDALSVGGSISGGGAVCAGTNSKTITLSGNTGSVTKWQSATTANFSGTVTDITGNTTTSLTAMNLTADTYYRAVVQSGVCAAANSSNGAITIDALSVGGTISGGGAVCTGTNSKTITLSGNTGSVTKWQSATTANFSGTVTDITGNTTTSLTATNITADTYYRAVVQNGTCAAVNSGNGAITVDALSVGGSISGGGAVCTGTNSKTITLSGNTGSVTKWQSSTTANFSGTVTDITGNTTTSFTATNLTTDTYYRAVVQSGTCAADNSGTAGVTVDALSVGGSISGGGAVCTGTNSKTITLSGNTGSVTKWQSAIAADFSGTVTDITGNTTTSLTATNLTADTYYRAVVQSGTCAADNSGTAGVTVDALSVGGSISGGGAVCTGTNSKTITLSSNTGSVTKWQSATTANFSGTVTDITGNTTTSLTATNITADTYYRAVVQNGTCAAINSSNGAITVDALSVGGTISGGGAVCTGTNSKTITLSGNTGSVTKWQSSTTANFSGTITDITGNTTTSLIATNLTADTYYRAVVQNGTCAATNSGNGAITVDALSVGGTVSGGGAVCTGTNSKTITLSGNTGSVTKWQTATAADFSGTVTDITSNTSTSLTAANLTADTYYRAVVQSGTCAADNSGTAGITVDALSVGGTISGGGAVCTGANSKTITLSGNTGSVTKWQSATTANFSGTVTDITSNTSTSLIATNLTIDTYYRAVVQNGTCAAVNSGNGAITVDALSVGGNISGGGAVCTGANSKTITLSGNTGSVTKWQSSSTANFSGTVTDITGNTTTSFTATNLTADTYYRAVVQNGTCAASNSSNEAITVDALSVGGSISGGGAVCTGTNSKTIALSGNTGSVTKWQSSTTANFSGTVTDITSNTSTSLTATNLSTTTYYRAIVQNASCTAANSSVANVTVNALPVVRVSPSSTAITTGSSTVLTASGADTYSWLPSTGLSATSGSSVTANPASTATYTVTGTNTTTNCTNTAAVVVTVNGALIPGGIGSDQTICSGSTPATLTSTTDASGGTGTTSYQWQQSTDNANFTNISGATTATYSPASLTQTTYYRRAAQTSSDAAVYTGVVTITVQSSIGGTLSGNATVCAGVNSKTLTLSGNTGSVVKWQSATTADFSGVVTDINNATSSLTGSNLNTTTYYRAVVQKNACAISNSSVGVITVNALPVVNVAPASTTITTGSSATLTASGADTYTWSPSTGLSATSGVSVTANPVNTTTYTVTGTNTTTNCINTTTVIVTVNPVLNPGTIAASQTICSGTLPATFTSATNASGGTGSINYQWQQSTNNTTFTNINGATSATYSPASLIQTTYYRRGAQTGTDAMVYSGVVSVTVQSSTGGTVSGNAVVCGSASSQTFTLSGHTGSVIKWQSAVLPDFSGTVTDINNTAASLTVNNVTTTTYYRAMVQMASCTTANSGTAIITVNALPTVTVTPAATSVTTGSTVVLIASGANTYTWSPSTGLSATTGASVTANPTASTAYTVTGTNTATGCSNTASVNLTVNAVLLPGVIAGPQSICSGTAPAALTSVSDASGGTGTISYQWQQSTDSLTFTNINGATSVTYSPASLTQTTYYRRVASTTTDASVYTNAMKITIQNRPLTGTIVGDCSVNKDSTRIYKVAGVANVTSYVWTLPTGWSGSSTDSSIVVHTGSTNGTISVVPYNGTCAGTGASYHVSVIDYAKVTIGASPGTVLGDNKSTSLITIQLIDVNGNPIHCSGGAATLCTSSGTFSDVIDHNDGTYTATLKSSANAAVICGTVNGIRISQTVTTQFTGPQGSISANGPIFATETPKLTFNFTEGIGPFTVIYRAGYKSKTDTLFNVTNNSTIPVALIDSTTTYRLVSVIGSDNARREDHFTRDTATVLIVAPRIVVTLKSDPPKLVKDSVYSTRLSVKVKNIGDVDLNSVQVKANLYDVFPSPVEFALDSVVFNGTTILQNMQYDGRQNFDLFARNNRQPDERLMAYTAAPAYAQTAVSLTDVDGADDHQLPYDHKPVSGYEEQPVNTPYFFATLSKLAVGVEGDIFIYLRIKPNGYKQPFVMQVAAVGTGHTASGAALANSLSNDNENENLHPEVTQKGDPLPTVISILPNPVIGVALSAGTPVQQTDGSFNVPLNYTLKNYGTVNLKSVALYQNLLRPIVAPGVFKLVGAVTASDNLFVNPSYDGRLDTNLLSANSMLGINQLATVQFTINIVPNQLSVLYRLQAQATGYSVEAAATVSDLSTDGINPDPDGNNVPDEHLISVIAINRTVPSLVSGTVASSGPVTYCGPAVPGITIAPVTLTQGGIDPYVYQWQSSADNITYTDILNATDSTYATGTIHSSVYLRRKVISGNQVAYSNAVFVQIHSMPKANITASGSVVLNVNGSVGLAANTAMSYEWSTGETTGNITVKTAGKYWVKITDDNGCWAVSDAVFVQPPPPVTVPATYIQGAFTNPVNIGVQVQTSATGAALAYYANASGGVATAVPVLPGNIGSYVYYVSQIVNGQESIRVPVQVNIISPAAVADIQKTLSKPATLQPDGSFLMGFTISAVNLRPELLDGVKIKDDLTRTFPSPLKFDVLSVTASGQLIVNNLYNGSTQTDLLADGSQLAGYQRDSIKMMLKVTPYGFAGNLNNIAEQTAKSPYGSFRMLSTDPADPASSGTARVPTKFNIPVVGIVIPGGFSPNRDGKNDTYVIIKPFNTRISIEVFNRWGNVVYRAADYNNEWDGKGNQSSLMGNDLPDGTYYYIIIATDKTTGTVRKFNGPLTLKR